MRQADTPCAKHTAQDTERDDTPPVAAKIADADFACAVPACAACASVTPASAASACAACASVTPASAVSTCAAYAGVIPASAASACAAPANVTSTNAAPANATFTSAAHGIAAPARGKPKNILFLLADDQRFGTIRALGNPDVHTPNLDWLVQNGTSFTGAHLPGGTSGAICMPSRAMLLTGRTLFHIEGEGQSIPEQHTMLPEVLRRAGYTCFGTGKWHNGPPAFTRGFSCGEDIFFGGMWDHWNVPVCRHDPTGVYDNVINFVSDFPHTNKPRRIHCDAIHPGVHSSRVVTDSALRFLKHRTDDAPFFAYVSYLAPHDPRTMPQQYRDLYDPAALTLPANWAAQHPFAFGVEDIRDETLLPTPRTQEALRNELADYYAMISHLDDEIGRLLSHLRETGEIDNTIVVFTSDNGLSLGGHGLLGKQNLYEESVRVPLVFAGGGVPQGQTVQGNVYLMDIFPTLCDLLRLPVPASVEGESFCAAFANPAAPLRETLYFAYNDLLRAVKHGRHKLIDYAMPGQPAHKRQLFDTQADPLEQHDLYTTQPALAAKLSEMLRAQSKVWEDTNHPYSDAFWGEPPIHTQT